MGHLHDLIEAVDAFKQAEESMPHAHYDDEIEMAQDKILNAARKLVTHVDTNGGKL